MVQGSGFTVQKLKERLIKVEKIQRFNVQWFKVKNRIIPPTRNREPITWNLELCTLNRFSEMLHLAKVLPFEE